MTRPYGYIALIVLFVVFGLYFTCWFTISIENRSGMTIDSIQIKNRFVNRSFDQIPSDSVITIHAFIPYDRKIQVRSNTDASIHNFMFTAENAYAGAKYNTVVIKEGISRVSP